VAAGSQRLSSSTAVDEVRVQGELPELQRECRGKGADTGTDSATGYERGRGYAARTWDSVGGSTRVGPRWRGAARRCQRQGHNMRIGS
jgi:hypothetical protein